MIIDIERLKAQTLAVQTTGCATFPLPTDLILAIIERLERAEAANKRYSVCMNTSGVDDLYARINAAESRVKELEAVGEPVYIEDAYSQGGLCAAVLSAMYRAFQRGDSVERAHAAVMSIIEQHAKPAQSVDERAAIQPAGRTLYVREVDLDLPDHRSVVGAWKEDGLWCVPFYSAPPVSPTVPAAPVVGDLPPLPRDSRQSRMMQLLDNDVDLCAFENAMRNLEYIERGVYPSRDHDLDGSFNAATISHAKKLATAVLPRFRAAYAALVSGVRTERRAARQPQPVAVSESERCERGCRSEADCLDSDQCSISFPATPPAPASGSIGDDATFRARLADIYGAYDESVEQGVSAPNDRAVQKLVVYIDRRAAAPTAPTLTDDEIMDIAEPFHDLGDVAFDEVAFARELIARMNANQGGGS
jgi:hypothetical protein